MVKILRFFLVFILCASLMANGFNDDFINFDRNFSSANSSDKLKFHHMLKNIYIKSIINGDKNLKIDALKRLIKSSQALNLNCDDYKKELKNLGVKFKEPQKSAQIKKNPSSVVFRDKKTALYLEQIIKQNGALKLKFNRAILRNEMNEFNLNTKSTKRFVIDFNAILLGKSRFIKNYICDEIRVSQFDKNVLRVVFSNKFIKNYDIKKNSNEIIISSNTAAAPKSPQFLPNLAKVSKQKTILRSQPNKFRASKIIVIDAGHGGKDAGALGNGMYEKNVVLQVALKTGKILQNLGYKVYFTRTKDKFINLRNRTKFANDKVADIFISIHANAAPNRKSAKITQGIETFFLSPARSERSMNAAALENKSDIEEMNHFSKMTFLNFLNREKIIASNKLAIDLQQNLLSNTRKFFKVSDGGVREAPFWVLVGALMPAVLVEIGYITHPVEGKRLQNEKYQDALAHGIADGVVEYFRKN